jgi:hypothetical protein
MRWIIPLLILAQAYAKTPDLWQINMPLAANTARDIEQALPHALQTVLIRTSGVTTIEDSDKITVHSAKNAIQHYHLTSAPCPDSESTCTTLHIQFKKEAIAQLLQELQLPSWTGARASSFINITIDDGLETVTLDNAHTLGSVLQETADKRGIDITLPQSPSQPQHRYRSEQTLVAKINLQEENVWQINWHLYTATDLFEWTSSSTNLTEALQASIDSLADFMHQQDKPAVETIAATSSHLIIQGIPNFISLEKTLKTLKAHPHVQQASLSEQSHNYVKIHLNHTLPLEKILATLPSLRMQDMPDPSSQEIITTWHNNDAPAPF